MVTEKYKGSTYGPVKFTNFPITTIVQYPKKNQQVTSYTQQHQEQKKTKVPNKTKIQKSRSTITVSQSFSDSNLLPHKLPQSSADHPTTPNAVHRGQDTGRGGGSYAQKLRKPSVSLSETHQKFNKKAESKTGRKISTNSTRLIQQFPQKFCTDNSTGGGGDRGEGVKTKEKKKGGGVQKSKSKPEANEGLIQVAQCGGETFPSQVSISTADHTQQPDNSNNNDTMFATDGKKPLSLMEQKKLQWAREKEELNGLWSPWGRPISNTNRGSNTSSYVNKLQTSSIQSVLRSEYHLPPIANNNSLSSPASRQAQLKSSLWTCDEAINMRVNGRSTLPICINATTGEVLYSSGSGSSDHDDMRDTLHVNNNAVVITGGNHNNNGIHNALSIKSLKYDSNNRTNYVDGKRTATSSHFAQQQSAHSVNSGHNGWSSVDEEAFTSGYHSEVNGSLSNSEDCGSRKGSGEMGKHGRRDGHSVIVHNIQMEPKLEIPDRGLTISREKLHENHHSNSGKNSHRSRIPLNAPPPAMRSSITVGLDSGKLEPDAYKELQKMEKERWLHELEKQREEQRMRKQQEKDEKRPKWGDKGIGVGHFWEPSSSSDNLPQPSRDDALATSPPAWLEKGLSRLQNSVSQPSLYEPTEFQGPPSTSLFATQSTMDLRNVSGLDGRNERNYIVDEPVITPEMDTNAEREKKRREAMEHQAAIRKQIEERQQRLKEERDRRLQEELKDEETAKLHRLRELEMIELEARRMGMAAMQQNQSEESEESPELVETKDVRKLLHKEERTGQKDAVSDGRVSRETVRSNISEGRRLSLDGKNSRTTGAGPEVGELPESKVPPQSPSYLTSSQSMVNIASPGPKARSHKSEPEDVGFLSDSLRARREKSAKESQGSNRSRSLSSHREFGTQTESEIAAAAQEKKNNPQHRSHNCLANNKGNNKSNNNLAEDTDTKKKQEKPRWGATPNKKQYIKQSEKDPMYLQRLKRRQDRIKKFEERLNAANIANGTGLTTGRGMDTGTESEDPTTNNSSSGNGRGRARSPPNRSRNRATNVGVNAENNKTSPRKQVPLKATARIQVSHKPPIQPGETPRIYEQDSNNSSRARKMFPDIPGRTIGPLNSAGHQDFDSFRMNRGGGTSSVNSSRFSSPSLESISSRNVETHHYMRQRVAGESVEVDLESRISTRSLEIRYEDQKGTEVHLVSPPSKKTIIESSSDEISTYRKTVINQTATSRISEEEEIEQRNQMTTSSRSMSNPPPPKGRVPTEKPPQPPASPIIKANNVTNTTKQTTVQSATSNSNLSAAESKTKSRSESRQRRVPPPKTISSTDMDVDVTADERKPAENKKRKGAQRTPAKVPIPNPLVNSSPLVSPVPHNPIPYPTRMGSPPVPAVLKKLQAGIPIEDLPVCDDPLYEVPRAQTAGSTSNGYKSVESDSSQSNGPPLLSRFSSNAGLEIDIDPAYELSSIRINTHSATHTEEDTEHNDSFDQTALIKEESEEDYDDRGPPPSSSALMMSHEPEDASDDREEDGKAFNSYEDEEHDEDDDGYGGKTTDGYDDPIYPYPIPRFSPRLKSQHGLLSPPTSPVVPRLSGRTTTLEVMADYRKFTLPDYDYDTGHLFPHVDVDGMDVTAAVHNIRRPSTQDTDLSKREKLISYVINNKDIQAQISARDSELSEKGIIEFNVRLPVNEEDNYGSSGAGDYDDYKDPLLSDRQRATIRWLYSSDSQSSNSKDSILTHLSYLKKGIQQQQHEWNVLPSDTEEETDYHYSGSANEYSSDDTAPV